MGVLSVPSAAVTTRGKDDDSGEKKEGEETPASSNNNESKAKKEEKLKELVFINDKGKAATREVVTGISDFENIEVISGLKEGEEIISGPFIEVSKRLKEGTLVGKKVEKKKDAKDTKQE